eukprot:269646-Ditylum_brightwellii.AAC.1
MMEVEMDQEMPVGDETSQVFPHDSLEVSMGKEKGVESKNNVGGDNAGSELHKNSREMTNSGEEFGSDNSKVSN